MSDLKKFEVLNLPIFGEESLTLFVKKQYFFLIQNVKILM